MSKPMPSDQPHDILDLDALLEAPARRAQRVARFCLRPDIEAEIDVLEGELDALTDDMGNPVDDETSAGSRSARAVALELQQAQIRYREAFRSVLMEQVSSERWTAFRTSWSDALQGPAPYPVGMWNELIAITAVAPTMSLEQVAALRSLCGHPQLDELGLVAWDVNVQGGTARRRHDLSRILSPR